MDRQEHVSRDGQLRLLVIVSEGDITIGFDGQDAHMHGDMLAALYACDEQTAAKRFISGILESKLVIAVERTYGSIRSAYVPEATWMTLEQVVSKFEDDRWKQPSDTLEFRLWDGTKLTSTSVR